MILTPARRKVFLCFWAASICWMYVGLLVNFHQHKIWGKELIPQFYLYKRGTDKPFKSWDISKKSSDNSVDSFDHFDFTFFASQIERNSFQMDESQPSPMVAVPPVINPRHHSFGLRAPPMA